MVTSKEIQRLKHRLDNTCGFTVTVRTRDGFRYSEFDVIGVSGESLELTKDGSPVSLPLRDVKRLQINEI